MSGALTIVLLAAALSAAPDASANSMDVDFDTDVLPVITRAGCNAAACHGAASGRGGFKLSLFGGDPRHDHDEIVRRLKGRRVNLAHPEQSLLLAKPTLELDHGGGFRFAGNSDEAALLTAWIAQGARRLELRRLQRIEVEPASATADLVPTSISLSVVAHFDDGSRRDVTRLAVYAPQDPGAVEVSPLGEVTVLRRGRHALPVRFFSQVATAQITVPLADDPVDLSSVPRNNFIDDEILRTLSELHLAPLPRTDDHTLLRRATLDLTGRLPTPEAVAQYAADANPRKFELLVDRLLDSPEFSEYWTYRLGRHLGVGSPGQGAEGSRAYYDWLHAQVAEGTPLDRIAAALVTAEGDTHRVGPANFYRVAGDARLQAEFVSQALMGVRLRCANCHDHPLDRWTQDDYHGLAAIFARVETGRYVRDNLRGEVTQPGTGEAARPKIPGGPWLDADEDGRQALVRWLTSPDNPYFAPALANRLWKAMMGVGLVEPDDDMRSTNPPSHPELLARLADDLKTSGYDLRHALRQIALSAAYQRQAGGNGTQSADRFYAHVIVRPLESEVLLDALSDVTDVLPQLGDVPSDVRAIALFDPSRQSPELNELRGCSRGDACAPGSEPAAGISGALLSVNGPLVNSRVESADGRLHRLLADGASSRVVVEEFYVRALGRMPDEREQNYWSEQLEVGDTNERRERLEDFLWSLLTCREFVTNR